MRLAVFDIGGTAVKTGFFNGNTLSETGSFVTPETFEGLVKKMQATIKSTTVDGIAISAPGAVDQEKGIIGGISAVPYLHGRPIFKELQDQLNLPIAIENDANCAGICEVEIGAGEPFDNVAFIVIGTGIGGAIFIDKHLYKGNHLFGGEFGLLKNNDGPILSMSATIVKAVNAYQQKKSVEKLDGMKLFELATNGDELANKLIDSVYDNLAGALYNLQVSFDFDAFILGGGISARPDLAGQLEKRLKHRLEEEGVVSIMPEIKNCTYKNNANLYGAALNYLKTISI